MATLRCDRCGMKQPSKRSLGQHKRYCAGKNKPKGGRRKKKQAEEKPVQQTFQTTLTSNLAIEIDIVRGLELGVIKIV